MNKPDELEELLSRARGSFHIDVHGLDTHVTADINKPGLMLAVYTAVKILEQQEGSFEKAMSTVKGLNDVLNNQMTVGEGDNFYGTAAP